MTQQNTTAKQVIYDVGSKPIKIWTDDVEAEALSQLKNIARLPFVAKQGVAVMPDCHAGKGSTIGTVIATDKAIIPAAVGVDIGCLDKDTEFLSPTGWVKISEYTGQKVLGFDVDSMSTTFAEPTAYIVKDCDKFYKLASSKGLNQLLSADHKVLYFTGTKARGFEPNVCLAEDFVARHTQIKDSRTFLSAFEHGGADAIATDNELRIRVMVSADGCLRERISVDNVVEIHVRKQRKIERCRYLLQSESIEYTEYKHKDGSVTICFTPKHWSKSLDFVYGLSARQLGVVAAESILWDGSEATVKGTTRRFYSTTVKANADAIQFAFTGSGTRTGIYTQSYPGKNWKDCYYVIPTKNNYVGIPPDSITQVVSEDGKAYCFTMPTGFFVARRGDNVFVTGNCGMVACRLSLKASDLPDSLSRLRSAIEQRVPTGSESHKGDGVQPYYQLAASMPLAVTDVFGRDPVKAGKKASSQLGTLGSGNHFIEVCTDENDDVWVMLHSGSRGIGNMIGSYYIDKAKELMERFHITLPDGDLAYLPQGDDLFEDYVAAVSWAQDYAMENRKTMLAAVLEAMKQEIRKEFTVTEEAINCHHNYVEKENHFGQNLWITRKGAIRAREGDLGIIPGSMGQRSYIVRGKGNKEAYCSCSHGAGRKMSRTAARKKFTIADLVAQTTGVECRKDDAVLDEIPGSYKDIDVVMKNQESLVNVVHTLKAVLCVKGS